MNFLNAFASVSASCTGKTVNLHVPLFADKSLIALTAMESAEQEEARCVRRIVSRNHENEINFPRFIAARRHDFLFLGKRERNYTLVH
jgi:hypothetical protein